MLSFNISLMIVVYDTSCCFNICLIWSVHVVDLHNVCDPGRVRSFRGMWSWPLMAVHFVDLYNFMNWLGPSIMCIGVLNVGRVRPLCVLGFWTLVGSVLFFWSYISLTLVGSVHFLDLYKFGHGWVRPLCGLISLTLGGIRPLFGLVSLTLVGSVHFVDL